MKEIRTLRADEIECRVQKIKENGCSLLLYKDARCDMRILDEVFGPMNWQRKHEAVNGNLFCQVGIRDENTGEWVWKEDAGSPSNTEAEKGHSSDAFKRACFNWGIGRELYTAPFIWVRLGEGETYTGRNNKLQLSAKVKFSVKNIVHKEGKIVSLTIVDQNGKVRYPMQYSDSQKDDKEDSSQRKEPAQPQDKRQKSKIPPQNTTELSKAKRLLIAANGDIETVQKILAAMKYKKADEIPDDAMDVVIETIQNDVQFSLGDEFGSALPWEETGT